MKATSLLCILFALTACGKSGPADTPVEAAARRTCMDTIESRAINKKTVTYLGPDTAVGHSEPNGQLEVSIKFSAKNEIGMASTVMATCTVSADGKSLVAIRSKNTR